MPVRGEVARQQDEVGSAGRSPQLSLKRRNLRRGGEM